MKAEYRKQMNSEKIKENNDKNKRTETLDTIPNVSTLILQILLKM